MGAPSNMSVDWETHNRRIIHRFGTAHEIKPASGAPALSVTGVFMSAGMTVLEADTPGVSVTQPSFRAMADKLAGVAVGDKLTHAGVAYRIATKPDPEQPSGHITMRLERQE